LKGGYDKTWGGLGPKTPKKDGGEIGGARKLRWWPKI